VFIYGFGFVFFKNVLGEKSGKKKNHFSSVKKKKTFDIKKKKKHFGLID
jgi:hypothetical protein